MGETTVPPIDVGAKLKGHDETARRVTNIWIDEDGVPHVTIESFLHSPHDEESSETLPYSDIRNALSKGTMERTNGGHDAWKWRKENVN
jgi:hypothetical protein